jgi:hypothetical protein
MEVQFGEHQATAEIYVALPFRPYNAEYDGTERDENAARTHENATRTRREGDEKATRTHENATSQRTESSLSRRGGRPPRRTVNPKRRGVPAVG